jgi:hypothetical protein
VLNVLMRKWGDGLSVGHLSNSLVSLLKENGYNHVPLYIGTWGPFDRSALVPMWFMLSRFKGITLWKRDVNFIQTIRV